jgi:hypothetical protein
VLTQYANWVTNKGTPEAPRGIVAERIQRWRNVAPDEVAKKMATPYPAINTGVLGYGCASRVAHEHWPEMTMRNPHIFISDETAMDLIWTEHPHVRLEDDRYNWSPRFGQAAEPVIKHYHGKKHATRPEWREHWWPEFLTAWETNYANIRDWCPAGDKRLAGYLKGNPEVLK